MHFEKSEVRVEQWESSDGESFGGERTVEMQRAKSEANKKCKYPWLHVKSGKAQAQSKCSAEKKMNN